MSADDYGHGLPDFTVNLLVRDVGRSVEFYRGVFGAKVHHSDADFAALRIGRIEFMVHADHTYDHHAWHAELTGGARRGLGAELRLFNLIRMSSKSGLRLVGRGFCRAARISRMVGGM